MTTETELPLFYEAPEPLTSAVHGEWRLIDGDLGFAEKTAFVPIVAGEMAAASAIYPIVFADGSAQPLAITGIEQENLFVKDGNWAPEAYIPAYVRRYPFGFIATINPEGFALGIDTASSRFVRSGEQGAALFENGEPSDLTRQALRFCDAFQNDAAATRAFTDALVAAELLIDRRAEIVLPDGESRGVTGFRIVDAARFAELPEALVLDWHRQGWLALVHYHLASLQRFQALLARREARQSGSPVPHGAPSSAESESLVQEKV